jgi:hypothetical protein
VTWFNIDGQLYDEGGVSEKSLVAAGAVGWNTEQEAEAHSQPTNPALSLVTLDLSAFHQGSQDINAVGSLTSDATAIPGFIQRLQESSTWVRVAEIGLGAILLVVVASAMLKPATSAVKNSPAPKLASLVAK